jgi:cobalt-zinc-cadmium efflux system protein
MNTNPKHKQSHQHHHEGLNSTSARLMMTMILNFIITVAEIIGGIVSGSLSLVSDALHNFSDTISVIVSYVAVKLKTHNNSYSHTFGLKRAEILAAVINSSVLIVISFFLFYEAILRFAVPSQIDTNIMILVASIGFVANILGTLLLKRDAEESINIRSSYLHLLSDTVSSGAVILGGIAIGLWNVNWIDPLLTILIGLYIIHESYLILMEAVHVLMEGAPPQISLDEIKQEVEKFTSVIDIHHIHLWTVGDNDVHLEAHINVKDMTISESDKLRNLIEDVLASQFGINHITLQFECNQCREDGLIGKHN